MSDKTAYPKEYNSTVWEYQEITPENGAFVLADTGKTFGPQMAGTMLSFTPDGEQPKPIIFPNKINAELYREFLMGENELHPVRNYEIIHLRYLPTGAGFYMRQRVAPCPTCHTLTHHGNAETGKFYCPNCQKAFLPI